MLLFASLPLLLIPTTQTTGPMGTWQGSFDINGPNGKSDHAQATLYIGRSGQELLGGLGSGDKDLGALQDLKVDGDKATFEYKKDDVMDLSFTLALKSDHLTGSGHGQMRGETVRVDVDFAKAPTVHTLFERVASQDDRMFDAFNARDISPIGNIFAKDLEFYHDKTGFTGYDWNIKTLKDTLSEKDHYRRQLDTTTLEVYEIKDFGAMEMGVHRFYTTSPGQPERLTATAKFANIWRFKHGKWELSRVMSYDHH